MKRINLFLVSLVTLVTLSVSFSSCGGGGITRKDLQVVSEGDDNGLYRAKLKNISSETLDGGIEVKIQCTDGTTASNFVLINNLGPGEMQNVTIFNEISNHVTLSSWSFVDE